MIAYISKATKVWSRGQRRRVVPNLSSFLSSHPFPSPSLLHTNPPFSLSLSTCTYLLLYLHNITHKQSSSFFSASQPCRYNQYLTFRNYYSPMLTLVTTLLQCFPPATGSCLSISSVVVVNRSVLAEESELPLLH